MKHGRASVLDITRTLDSIREGTRKESKKHGKKKYGCASLLGTKRCTLTYGISISEILFNLKCKHIITVLIIEYKQQTIFKYKMWRTIKCSISKAY